MGTCAGRKAKVTLGLFSDVWGRSTHTPTYLGATRCQQSVETNAERFDNQDTRKQWYAHSPASTTCLPKGLTSRVVGGTLEPHYTCGYPVGKRSGSEPTVPAGGAKPVSSGQLVASSERDTCISIDRILMSRTAPFVTTHLLDCGRCRGELSASDRRLLLFEDVLALPRFMFPSA